MRALGLAILLLWLGSVEGARAESYEWQRTQQLLTREGLELDPAPEGKVIAWVRIMRDDVFVEDEIWPTWFNLFHALTREEVVRRELLFETGEPLAGARIEESMRNLRGMGVFALVRIAAVRAKDPGSVGVVVHTRDLWSLRLEQDFNITTQINSLMLRLTERNLAGRQKSIGADFSLVPKTYTLQEFYYARRVWGSPFSLNQSAGAIFNRGHGRAEGSLFSGSAGRPYYNLQQRYDYGVEGSFTSRVARRLRDGEVDTYELAKGVPVNRVWREEAATARLYGSLRRGQAVKHTLGGSFSYRSLDAFAVAESELPAGFGRAFERLVLPRQRREVGPGVSYSFFLPRFAVFENLGSFSQSENVRLGPYADLGTRLPLRAFGSSTDSLVVASGLGYVVAPAGGLVEVGVSASGRLENGQLVDQLGTALARGAMPIFAGMRVVSRTSLELRRNDTANSLVALGANNGLRGYPSQWVYGYGASRLLQNLELRTLPLAWQALHVGGVLFGDVGSVFQRFREMRLHYAVGIGLRVLFPQFSRYPFTLDGGVGLDPPFRFTPTFTGQQVVPLTATEDALAN